MAQKKKRRKVKAPPAPSVSDRLEEAREKVFLAIGIVSCARFASDSKICDGQPDLVDGLRAALDVLEDVSEALELLIDDAK